MTAETITLEVAIEMVLRNGPTFETIAGLCKMAVEAEREACVRLVWNTPEPEDEYVPLRQAISNAIKARSNT